MQFADQHFEAIEPTVKVRDEVSCSIFDDHIKEMGTILVSQGQITITLDYVPAMVSKTDTKQFLIDAIGCGLDTCFTHKPEAFERK